MLAMWFRQEYDSMDVAGAKERNGLKSVMWSHLSLSWGVAIDMVSF